MDAHIMQSVFEKIESFLPDEWIRVVFVAEYTEGSYSMKFYSKNIQEKYIDCFSLPGISKALLITAFMEIDTILANSRKELSWTVFTMTVEGNGHVQFELDYDDHSEDILSFQRKWKETYLI